jgi:aryl-alcohol dehydrogenase-like predicted oxidoreductase
LTHILVVNDFGGPKMEKIKFGNFDNKVSRIGLGTWAIGGWMWGGTDETRSIHTLRTAFDLGINLVDTAPQYGFGLAEEIVGRAIAEHGNREKLIIATKVGLEWESPHKIWRNSTRKRIFQEIDDSLRRLRTEYIDLYQVHWPDPDTPLEETAEALYDLYEQGKIRAIGVSNFNAEQMERWRKVAPLHSNQLQLNLFQQHLLNTDFAYCYEHKIDTITYGTLAYGLLTGKFNSETTFPEDDHRFYKPMFRGEYFLQFLAAVDELKKLAASRDKSVAQLAVRWALQQKGVTIVLWGARRPEQLNDILGTEGWELSKEELEKIQQIINEKVTKPLPPKKNPGPPARSSLR